MLASYIFNVASKKKKIIVKKTLNNRRHFYSNNVTILAFFILQGYIYFSRANFLEMNLLQYDYIFDLWIMNLIQLNQMPLENVRIFRHCSLLISNGTIRQHSII